MFFTNNLHVEQQYPIFVYGTLRPGEGNYRLVEKRIIEKHRAYTRGMSLFSCYHFPMAVDSRVIPTYHPHFNTSGDDIIRGDIFRLGPHDYDTLLARLDRLEGFNRAYPEEGMFKRELRQVWLDGEFSLIAWMYIGNARYLDSTYHLIPHGDWVQYYQDVYGVGR